MKIRSIWEKVQLPMIIILSALGGYFYSQIQITLTALESRISTPSVVQTPKEDKVPSIPKKVERKNLDFDSKTFFVRYTGKGLEREKRYGALESFPTFKEKWITWSGGQNISIQSLEELCKIVFKRLPHIKTSKESVALVVETAIAESNGGRIIKSKGGDYGTFQIRISAAKSNLKWLQENHPDVYKAVISFRNKDLSEGDNLIQNIPYGIAMCITQYWRIAGSQYYKYIDTIEKRGIMWKSAYNTYKGQGTVNAYIQRVKGYPRNTKNG